MQCNAIISIEQFCLNDLFPTKYEKYSYYLTEEKKFCEEEKIKFESWYVRTFNLKYCFTVYYADLHTFSPIAHLCFSDNVVNLSTRKISGKFFRN